MVFSISLDLFVHENGPLLIYKFYFAVMDFESNCGDADDELQIFENTPETKSATTTNVSVGCGTSTNDRTKSVGASGKRISSDVGKEVVAKKVRGNTSEVWNNYEKIGVVDGVEKCKCSQAELPKCFYL